jgi:hypothetical protein
MGLQQGKALAGTPTGHQVTHPAQQRQAIAQLMGQPAAKTLIHQLWLPVQKRDDFGSQGQQILGWSVEVFGTIQQGLDHGSRRLTVLQPPTAAIEVEGDEKENGLTKRGGCLQSKLEQFARSLQLRGVEMAGGDPGFQVILQRQGTRR